MEVSPAMLINQPLPCGAPLMPCWYAVIQLRCEQVIMCTNISVQQGHKAHDNMLQSLNGQPLARNQLSLQLTGVLVINPCNVHAVILYFVLVT